MLQVVEGSLFGLRGARKPRFDESEFLPACIAERFERIECSEIIPGREDPMELTRRHSGLGIHREDSHATRFTFTHYRIARNESNAAENSVKRDNLLRPLE